MSALNDPALVACEYADESRLALRSAFQGLSTGLDARQVVFDAIADARPRRVLEVGCGQGELAARLTAELGAGVVAVDQSRRMVELARGRGVEAFVGDVHDLPFRDGTFDCVVAAWVLYHASDLDRAVRELRRVLRPDGRFVAATNGERTLSELWDLIDFAPGYTFSAENGEWPLLRHFTVVERREIRGTLTFPDHEAARRYIAASIVVRDRVDRLPFFEGPLHASRHAVVFVCEP
jgi:SAM-dependent methyltransferase